MALDMTSFASALKVWYTSDRVQNLTYTNNPLLAMISKMENFRGKNLPIPIIYGNPQRRSQDFATAQAGTSTSKITDFVLTRNHDYSMAAIDNETLEASKGDAAAFMEAAVTEIDGAINSIVRSLAISLYRNGSGSVGQVANTSFATTSLTLTQSADVTNFEVGQVLQLSATDGTGSVETGTLTVTAVNRDTGVLTTSVALATAIPTIATSDYIFQNGDYGLKVKGLLAWLPSTSPTNTPFFSVDRSVDPTRLAGIRYDGSAMPIEEAIIGAIHRVAREGGTPTHCFMSFEKWDELVKSLGTKVQYIDDIVKTGDATVSFKGVMVHGPKGPVKVIPDQNCPSDRGFLLQLDTFKLYSLGKAPQILDADGLRMLRQNSADAVECRIGYYAQVGCNAPGRNANIKLS
jgi:hypothetical protein